MAASDKGPVADAQLRAHLLRGQVIPAHPLALTSARRLDERRQRALTRYYLDADAGGLAVGVHTTQFAIHDGKSGLYQAVLELAADVVHSRLSKQPDRQLALIAGVVGATRQAVTEARMARDLGYHAALVSLSALRNAPEEKLIEHCARVADVLPVFGFYLQPAVGGRDLGYEFWRGFAEIPQAVAVKIAPFDRYRTAGVVRAICDSGRTDIALYTGNDDSIVADLLTTFGRYAGGGAPARIVGGLLGQWAVWTSKAVHILRDAHRCHEGGGDAMSLLATGAALTEANAAIFDTRNSFAGSIAGIHEVLRRQGLLNGTWCLDEGETLSPGQSAEIGRALALHPELTDDEFVIAHLDEWLA